MYKLNHDTCTVLLQITLYDLILVEH